MMCLAYVANNDVEFAVVKALINIVIGLSFIIFCVAGYFWLIDDYLPVNRENILHNTQAKSKASVQLSEDANYPSPVIKLQKIMAESFDELPSEKELDRQLQETLAKLQKTSTQQYKGHVQDDRLTKLKSRLNALKAVNKQ